jgi:hypothetical protein
MRRRERYSHTEREVNIYPGSQSKAAANVLSASSVPCSLMKLTIMLIAAIQADCSQANMDLLLLLSLSTHTRELIACCTPAASLAGTEAMKQISYNLLALRSLWMAGKHSCVC